MANGKVEVKKRIAVFIDRDGTITEEVGYVNHADRLKLIHNAAKAICLLNKAGILAICASNQAGVARGYFPLSLVYKVNEKLNKLLKRQGAYLDAIYFCPHHKDGAVPDFKVDCDCRKPKIGMIKKAADEFNIDIRSSYAVGDKYTDVEFARNAGCMAIMVKTGYGKGELEIFGNDWKDRPDCVAEDLFDAVRWILRREGLEAEKIETCKNS